MTSWQDCPVITMSELEEMARATDPEAKKRIDASRALLASLPYLETDKMFSSWSCCIITCQNCGRQEDSAFVGTYRKLGCVCQKGCNGTIWEPTHRLKRENIRPPSY